MGRVAKEVSGQVICFLGFVGVCLACGIPMWKVTMYIGANIVTGQIVWDGLWMQCVMQATGQMQCSLQTSIMSLSPDLQAARALTVISLVIAFIGFAISFVGSKCTSCLKKETSQTKVVIVSGVLCIIAAVLTLIPVSWSSAVTILDYQNINVIQTEKRDLGACIYIGWGSVVLLIIGGSVLCSSCPPERPMYRYQGYPPQYVPYPGSVYSGSYRPPATYRPPQTYYPSVQYTSGKAGHPGTRVPSTGPYV